MFCVAIFGMTQLTMQTGWETYLDENSEKGIIYSEYIGLVSRSDSIILIIETVRSAEPGHPLAISIILKRISGSSRISKGPTALSMS